MYDHAYRAVRLGRGCAARAAAHTKPCAAANLEIRAVRRDRAADPRRNAGEIDAVRRRNGQPVTETGVVAAAQKDEVFRGRDDMQVFNFDGALKRDVSAHEKRRLRVLPANRNQPGRGGQNGCPAGDSVAHDRPAAVRQRAERTVE